MSVTEPDESAKKRSMRNRIFLILGTVIIVIALLCVLYWFFIGRFFVSTDDAYVQGNQVMLTAQIPAGIAAIYADNTDLVKQGQLVVLLDKTDYLLKVEEKKEGLANTVRQVSQLFENVREREALVEVRRAELIQSKLNLSHRTHLVETGAVAQEDYEEHKTDVAVKEANYLFSLRDLDAAKVLVTGTTVETHPLVQDAVVSLREAQLSLIRCEVIAPATGYVARRKAQVGDWILPGETLLMIVPLDFLWVDANYKETQLSDVRIDQPVSFTADLYGGSVEYHGKVVGLTSGTGSAFALLPAQNASGNWIKIVQRLPVRISIAPEDLKKNPLFIGLSTRVTIDVHDTSGKMLCLAPPTEPAYTTYIYEEQARQLDYFAPAIEAIIQANKSVGEDEHSCQD